MKCLLSIFFIKNYLNKIFSIPVIWIFDFDKEWVHEYLNLNEKKWFYKQNNSHFQCRLKKHNVSNTYWLLIPVPNNEIKNQVIKDEIKTDTVQWLWLDDKTKIYDYQEDSKMEIEHLFYDSLKDINNEYNGKLNSYLFEKDKTVGWWKYIKLIIKDEKKVEFAKKITSWSFFEWNIHYKEYLFNNFEPIYKVITDIINWKYNK